MEAFKKVLLLLSCLAFLIAIAPIIYAQELSVFPIENGWIISENQFIAQYDSYGTVVHQVSYNSPNDEKAIKLISTSLTTDNELYLFFQVRIDEQYSFGVSKNWGPIDWLITSPQPIKKIASNSSGEQILIEFFSGQFYQVFGLEVQKIKKTALFNNSDILTWNWKNDSQLLFFYKNGQTQHLTIENFEWVQVEKNIPSTKLKLREIIPIPRTNFYWVKDNNNRLQLLNFFNASTSNLNLDVKSSFGALNEGLLIYSNELGIEVNYPLLPRLNQQIYYPGIKKLYVNTTNDLLIITEDGFQFEPNLLHETKRKLTRELHFQKKIFIEEITNNLTNQRLNTLDWATKDYRSKKDLIRKEVTLYMKSLTESYLPPIFSLIEQLQTNKTAPLDFIKQLYWEDDNLDGSLGSNEPLRLTIKLDSESSYNTNTWSFTPFKKKSIRKLKNNYEYVILLEAPLKLPNDSFWTLSIPELSSNSWQIPVKMGSEAKIDHFFYEWIDIGESQKKELHIQFSLEHKYSSEIGIEIMRGDWVKPSKTNQMNDHVYRFEFDLQGNPTTKNPIAWRILLGQDEIKRGAIGQSNAIERQQIVGIPNISQHPLLQIERNHTGRDDSTFVLIIGNKNYHNTPDATYAHRDAKFVYTYANQLLGVPEKNILLIEDATYSDFIYLLGQDSVVARLAELMGNRYKRLFIYYSGHGVPSLDGEEAYLLPVDAHENKNSYISYSLASFLEQIRILPVEQSIVVLESCFSGLTGNGESLFPNSSSVGVRLHNPLLAKENSVVFTASANNQLASWLPTYGCSLFTYHFLRSLKMIASEEIDNTVESLFNELTTNPNNVSGDAARLYGRIQHPQLQTNAFEMPLILKDN